MNILRRVVYEVAYQLDSLKHSALDFRDAVSGSLVRTPCVDEHCSVCYEETHGGPHYGSPYGYASPYACECGWLPPTEGYYYIDGFIHIDCTGFDDKTHRMVPEPPDGVQAYPIRGAAQYNYGLALEFGGTPTEWDETHRCPFHGEFTFANGSH